ncbi:MAG: 4-methyl-5(b-hydroxyethyl)-thiazole monophosphate biosynthesis [Myxococcota bacterium]|jgi:4-methyl-5(b-hydroxyethyl)-thiazole monophosphate biosynthesis
MSKPRVLIPLGRGVEELEAVACIDVLRRAGCHVVTASVGGSNPIIGRNRIRILADIDITDALAEWGDQWDLVLLPGGVGGVEAMESDAALMQLLTERVASGGLTAAICAAPRLLAAAGLNTDVPITGHPACAKDLKAYANYSKEAVVTGKHTITSRGAGTAVEFALACAARLVGADVAAKVRVEIVG